jgi:hypothetical protein
MIACSFLSPELWGGQCCTNVPCRFCMHWIILDIQNALDSWLIVDLGNLCWCLSVFKMVKCGFFWWLWVPELVWIDRSKNIMCKWQVVDKNEGQCICTTSVSFSVA